MKTWLAFLCREEAARLWQKREAEWEKERLARERLMKEVLDFVWSVCMIDL